MNKIYLVSDIIKTSLKFDTDLKNFKLDNLKDYANEINMKINNLKLLIIKNDSFDQNILNLCEKINNVNYYVIKIITDTKIEDKNEDNNGINPNDNTLLLFYNNKCDKSQKFIPEWNKIKSKIRGKVNTISINCSNPKHNKICSGFNVYEYPMIKLITTFPTKINDYYGELNAESILNEFMLM